MDEERKLLIRKLNDLVRKVEDKTLGMDKVIPYLGWFWRDIDEDTEYLIFSLPKGSDYYWLDEAQKWDYPEKVIRNPGEIKIILERMISILEAFLLLVEVLPKKEE